jgi:hypothetical protein
MISEKNIKRIIVIVPLAGVLLTSVILINIFISEINSQYNTEVHQLIIDEELKVKKTVKNRVENIINLLEKDYEQIIQSEKEEVKNTVNIAYNIIQNTYNENKRFDKNTIIL